MDSDLGRLYKQLRDYITFDERERRDREEILQLMEKFPENIFLRENENCHFTASCWITNRTHDKILMAYHNIYQTWAWAGGHANGDANLRWVAKKEACEETGLTRLDMVTPEIFSVEIIPVEDHYKNGKFVKAHRHLDCCFLFEADEEEAVHSKPDENSGVRWFSLEEAVSMRKEPMMREIYRKLNKKLLSFPAR